MEKSALQIARAAYQPKLPAGLRGNVSIKEGEPTQSVGDREEIKKLFPNTYGMPLVEFVPSDEKEGICSDEHRYHPFGWTGSWWSQRNLRPLR